MKSIFSLGIIICLIISSTSADDCSSKTTEETCTGSCKWKAGTQATCKAKTTCELNAGGTACVSNEGCGFTPSSTTPASCDAACTSSDDSSACTTAGCVYNEGCTVPNCEINTNGNGCTPTGGCNFTPSSTTAAKCEATATCTLNTQGTACTSSEGCTFTAAVAGSCSADSSNDNNNNNNNNNNSKVLKVSFICLMFLFSLF